MGDKHTSGSRHLDEALERLDSILVEFQKWVNARVPLPVNSIEANVEQTLFNILSPLPVVDAIFPSLAEEESESSHVDTPSLSPTVNTEECQLLDGDIGETTLPQSPSIPFQNNTATPAPHPISVSALTPAESCPIVQSSKGYNQAIVELVTLFAILQFRVNHVQFWLTSQHRLLTCSELSLQAEPPPFPTCVSCSGSMNYVF